MEFDETCADACLKNSHIISQFDGPANWLPAPAASEEQLCVQFLALFFFIWKMVETTVNENIIV